MANTTQTTPKYTKALKITQVSVLTGSLVVGMFALGVSTSGNFQTVGMLGATIPNDMLREAEMILREADMIEQNASTKTISDAFAIQDIIQKQQSKNYKPTSNEMIELDINRDQQINIEDIELILQHQN